MEIKEIYIVVTLSSIIAGVLGILMYLMSRARNDRYDLELKRMQLDAMRSSLEQKAYDINDAIMSDPARWQNVNHLLIEGLRNDQKGRQVKSEGVLNTSFFDAAGIDLRKIKEIQKRVFVLTPFHSRHEQAYSVIQAVCARLNLECKRGDEEFRPGAVLSHILEMMAQASVIIVNINGRNPNVYYELGIAHAMGKKTILIASDIEGVPFDIQSQRIVLYKSVSDLELNLTSFLARTVYEDKI